MLIVDHVPLQIPETGQVVEIIYSLLFFLPSLSTLIFSSVLGRVLPSSQIPAPQFRLFKYSSGINGWGNHILAQAKRGLVKTH